MTSRRHQADCRPDTMWARRIELSLHTSSVATALGDTNGMYITEQTCCLLCHVLAEGCYQAIARTASCCCL